MKISSSAMLLPSRHRVHRGHNSGSRLRSVGFSQLSSRAFHVTTGHRSVVQTDCARRSAYDIEQHGLVRCTWRCPSKRTTPSKWPSSICRGVCNLSWFEEPACNLRIWAGYVAKSGKQLPCPVSGRPEYTEYELKSSFGEMAGHPTPCADIAAQPDVNDRSLQLGVTRPPAAPRESVHMAEASNRPFQVLYLLCTSRVDDQLATSLTVRT